MCINFFLGKSNALGEPLLKVIWQNIASVYDEAGMGRGGGGEGDGGGVRVTINIVMITWLPSSCSKTRQKWMLKIFCNVTIFAYLRPKRQKNPRM